MEFGILSLTGLIIVAVMMVPNIIFALMRRGAEERPVCRAVLIIEQIGRYGSMALMVLPLGVWSFGFKSPEELVAWGLLCGGLLAAYLICWFSYMSRTSGKKQPSGTSLGLSLGLAVLPCVIFILRGVFLRHWLLAAFGLVFAFGHIYVTWKNNIPVGLED